MLFKKAQSKLNPNWNRKKSSNRKTNNFYIRFEILKKQAMLFLLEEVFFGCRLHRITPRSGAVFIPKSLLDQGASSVIRCDNSDSPLTASGKWQLPIPGYDLFVDKVLDPVALGLDVVGTLNEDLGCVHICLF